MASSSWQQVWVGGGKGGEQRNAWPLCFFLYTFCFFPTGNFKSGLPSSPSHCCFEVSWTQDFPSHLVFWGLTPVSLVRVSTVSLLIFLSLWTFPFSVALLGFLLGISHGSISGVYCVSFLTIRFSLCDLDRPVAIQCFSIRVKNQYFN